MAIVSSVSLPAGSTVTKNAAGQTVVKVPATYSQLTAAASDVKAKGDDGSGQSLLGQITDKLQQYGGFGIGGIIAGQKGVSVSGVTGGAVNAAKAVGGGLGNMIQLIGDPSFWLRIGMGALGLFLAIVGIVFMLESNKAVRQIQSSLPMPVPV